MKKGNKSHSYTKTMKTSLSGKNTSSKKNASNKMTPKANVSQ